ncbi:MAG: hypothetical protein HY000_13170 [Planctomycetes bacterium]|nr:hypothetical protein [Planctomycetota bacterium]
MSKQSYTPESLNAVVKRLRRQSARLVAIAKAMEVEDVDSLDVDHHKMMGRGLDAIDNFLNSADRALRDDRRRRG